MTDPKQPWTHVNSVTDGVLPARDLAGLRVVAVHAHPDDETITMGGTLAQLSRRGADVTVVTCTLGEEGEVIGPTWQQLVAAQADQLGGLRITELNCALDGLCVRGEFLGGAGKYRDSGMAGTPAANNPRALVNNADSAQADLTQILRRIRPQLVLTYDPHGGYGHPDHIQAHRITHAAAAEVGVERLAWQIMPAPRQDEGLCAIAGVPTGWREAEPGELDAVSEDLVDCVTALTDCDVAAKLAGFHAHATQLQVADGSVSVTNPAPAYAEISDRRLVAAVYCLSNRIAQPLLRQEYFHVAAGAPIPAGGDVAAGLALGGAAGAREAGIR